MHGTQQEHHQPSMFLDQPAAVEAIISHQFIMKYAANPLLRPKNDIKTLQEETYQPIL